MDSPEIKQIHLRIAEACHEMNRAWCELHGDHSQVPWAEAEEWQRESALSGIKFLINNRDATPISLHEEWLRNKLADGWKYGPAKDVDKKEHPCMVPYDKLPFEQRAKDTIFRTVFNLMKQNYMEQLA